MYEFTHSLNDVESLIKNHETNLKNNRTRLSSERSLNIDSFDKLNNKTKKRIENLKKLIKKRKNDCIKFNDQIIRYTTLLEKAKWKMSLIQSKSSLHYIRLSRSKIFIETQIKKAEKKLNHLEEKGYNVKMLDEQQKLYIAVALDFSDLVSQYMIAKKKKYSKERLRELTKIRNSMDAILIKVDSRI